MTRPAKAIEARSTLAPLDAEVWANIAGSPYDVSTLGAVRRGRRILAQRDHNGYRRVELSIQGKRQYPRVHQLVARVFLGPCPEGMVVAHLNGVRHDNRIGNLAYKTRAENEADKIVHGTSQHGSRNHMAKLNDQQVAEIRARLAAGEMQRTIAADYGVSFDLISKINVGKAWVPARQGSPETRVQQHNTSTGDAG